jgi:hypothetical protein
VTGAKHPACTETVQAFHLVKKVINDFFACASSAKHFAKSKMLLRPKSL